MMERKKEFEQMKQEYQNIQMNEEQLESYRQTIEKESLAGSKNPIIKISLGIVAAACAAFIILPNTSASIAYAMEHVPILGNLVSVVTFRDYKYDSERNSANVKIPQIVVEAATGTEEAAETEEDNQVALKIQKTVEEINTEIQQISEQLIQEFQESLENQEGYQDITVTSEVLCTTDDYFALKLICFLAMGSGAEWDYYYTIDLNTGERMALADFFLEGADYKAAISDNIKEQMRTQMEEDDSVMYWLDDDVPEWNFDTITDETGFYMNENGEIVIAFNEGDVAPMYMGCVEFVIDDSAIAQIRKD